MAAQAHRVSSPNAHAMVGQAPTEAQSAGTPPPGQAVVSAQPAGSANVGGKRPRTVGKPNGEHLAEWMNRHKDLTPDQQQKALESEPGFRDLPPQTQQRMRDRLAQLNSMTPEKRQRLLERNEAMENLTPAQRGQVQAAMRQLAALPPDQRLYVSRTFRGLRALPPAQRQAVVNSDRFTHLTDPQRAALNNLLQVEPLLPPPYDAGDQAAAQTPHP